MANGVSFVSVMMTCFNGERSIAKAIRSLLDQSHCDFELIIVDDGSQDRTCDIVRSFSDQRIRLLEAGRLGRSAALNVAWKACRHELIANLDSDDWCEPGRLEKQIKSFAGRPLLGVLGTGYTQVFDDAPSLRRNYPSSDRECRRALSLYGPFCHSSVMYRREALEAIGGFDESLVRRIDLDAWVRIAAAGYQLGNIPEHLVFHYKNDQTFFERSGSRWQHAMAMARCNFNAIHLLQLPRYLYAFAAARIFWSYLPSSFKFWVRKRQKISEQLNTFVSKE